ncbi:MAG: efflux transporter outer membrane subunit [Thermoanaerobaculia bacterium]
MKKLIAPVLLGAVLSGCAMGPDYKRPDTAVPENHRGAAAPATEASFADLAWWDATTDPVLRKLVAEALEKNQDLKIAAARVEEYRAYAGINPLWPTVNAGAGATRAKSSETTIDGAGGQTRNVFDLSAGVSWEIDLWGRLRRTNESTAAQYLATEEARRGVYLSLVSDVATAYLQLRSLDMQLETAKRTLESRKASYDLVDKRLLGGVGNKLESSQSASAVAQTEATIPDLEQSVFVAENLLCRLLGRPPGPIERGKALEEIPLHDVPAGLPSALLERRPDVREAEQVLRAANAQVGVAEASLFPQLSLTGALGFQSGDLSDLLKSGSFAWNAGAGLLAPIFQGGRLRRNLDAAKARWEQARLAYEKAALAAFGDVATSLNAIQTTARVVAAQRKNVAALREAEQMALTRFDGGVSPYFEVLDAQRELFTGEVAYANALRDQRVAIVRLYRALGGGWNQPEKPPAEAPAQAPAPAN